MNSLKFDRSFLLSLIDQAHAEASVPERLVAVYKSLLERLEGFIENEEQATIFSDYLQQVIIQCKSPTPFPPFHPMDETRHKAGKQFFSCFIDQESSTVLGQDNLDKIASLIEKKENVILFSNHQIEPDPQAIDLAISKTHPELVKNMIFIAGEKVVTDPFTIPFSLGYNIISIYSKKHIENPPENKEQKQIHNQKTMQVLVELLQEKGKIVWVAPSGGRDRPDENNELIPAALDPASILMFALLAKKSQVPTHFFPLSLKTYSLLPPPKERDSQLGEERILQKGPVSLCFGDLIDLELLQKNAPGSKNEARQYIAKQIYKFIYNNYKKL